MTKNSREGTTAEGSLRGLQKNIGELLLWHLQAPPDRGPRPDTEPDAVAAMLVNAAVKHRVEGVLYESLAISGDLTTWPEAEHQALKRARQRVAAQYLRVLAELHWLGAILDDAKLEWLVMKGPAVALLGYDDPTCRWFSDLDVLVNARDFGTAIDALTLQGAVLVDVNWQLQYSMRRAEATVRLPFGTWLDLHWHPVNERRARQTTAFDVSRLLEGRRFVLGAGRPVPVADPVANMVLVCLHASLSGGHRLTWLKDIECLARRDPPDWDDLVKAARQAHVALPVGLILRRSQRLLKAPVPDGVVRSLVGEAPWGRLSLWGELLATPTSLGRGAGTGIAVMSSLRGSPTASAAALARASREHFAAGLHSRSAKRGNRGANTPARRQNPLSEPAGPDARARYLDSISRAAATSAYQPDHSGQI